MIVITSSIAGILKVIKTSQKIESIRSANLCAYQITNSLYCAKYESIGSSLIYYDEKNRKFEISLRQDKIIKEPGYVVFLDKVENIYFYQENHKLFMEITMNQINYTYWIGSNYEIK